MLYFRWYAIESCAKCCIVALAFHCRGHGLINYIDIKAKFHLKKNFAAGGGGVAWGSVGDSILQLLTVFCLFWAADRFWPDFRSKLFPLWTLSIGPDSEPTKLLHHSKRKPGMVGGLRLILNTCREVPFTGQYFRWRHFALVSI